MRELARSVAKSNMQREGITGINKKNSQGNSYFALNWRDYVFKTAIKRRDNR